MWRFVMSVLGCVVLGFAGNGLADGSDVSGQGRHLAAAAFEQKTVVVTAMTGVQAQNKAENQNPGWKAISVTSADPFNPKNNQWEVLLQR